MDYVDEARGPRFASPDPEVIAAIHAVKEKAAEVIGLTVEERDLLFGSNGDPIPSIT